MVTDYNKIKFLNEVMIMKIKSMVICAVFSATLCIFCVLTVPIGPVPVSMATFAIMLTAIILGPKKSSISVIIYILLGSIGLPVFSGFKGGFQVLAGPTGGYIWSYIFMALLIGSVAKKCVNNKIIIFIGCIASTIVCYILGTVQFAIAQGTSFMSALSICVLPFIPFDIAKAVLAVFLGTAVKNRLIKARLIQ